MGLARNLIRSNRRPLSRPIGPSPVTRNFVFGDGIDNYIGIDTPRTASGDFELEFLYTTSDDFGALVSGSGFELLTGGTGSDLILSGPTNSGGIATGVPLNRLTPCRLVRSGSNVTLTVNGTAVGGNLNASVPATLTIDRIMMNNSGVGNPDYFDGSVANLNFISGWNQNELFEINGSDTGLTYNNFASTDSHEYQLSSDGTQWNQVPPVNSNLPDPLVIA